LRRLLYLVVASVAVSGIIIGAPGRLHAQRAAAPDTLEGRAIKEIRITGAKNTKPPVIRGAMTSRVGEPYTLANVEEDYEGLDKLGVFSEVEIEAAPEGGGVALNLDVRETLRYLPVIAGEISDENGISLGGGLKSVNLLGSGISLSATARFGGATTIEIFVKSPYQARSHFTYQLEYYHRDRENALHGFGEVADEIGLTLGRTMRREILLAADYAYQIIESDTDGKTLSTDNVDHVSTLGVTARYDSRDLWSNPGRGWYNALSAYWSGFLGGDSDFLRLRLDLRRYHRISRGQVLAVFSMLTATRGTVGTQIAEWQTFGLGGSNTVRGWDLGSRAGKSEFINTVEYRYTWIKPRPFSAFGINLRLGLQVAVFADFASAWFDDEGFRKSWIGGAGAGVRILIPYVDMLRIDFGIGQAGLGVSAHLATQEKPDRQVSRIR
jgi:outer membrane protein assembly factor BamA